MGHRCSYGTPQSQRYIRLQFGCGRKILLFELLAGQSFFGRTVVGRDVVVLLGFDVVVVVVVVGTGVVVVLLVLVVVGTGVVVVGGSDDVGFEVVGSSPGGSSTQLASLGKSHTCRSALKCKFGGHRRCIYSPLTHW